MALMKTHGVEEVSSGIENRIDSLKANKRFRAGVRKVVGNWIEEVSSCYRESETNELYRRRKRISSKNS